MTVTISAMSHTPMKVIELYRAQDWSEYNRIANRVGLTTYWRQIQEFRARERS